MVRSQNRQIRITTNWEFMRKSIIKILLLLAIIICPTINAQAKLHVELGYRYNIGIRERKIGTDLYLDHYNKYSYMIHLAALYNFTPRISAGIGAGFVGGMHRGAFPVYATFRYRPIKQHLNAYVFTDLGYAPASRDTKEISHGWMWNAGIGYTLMFRRHFGLNFQICYNMQQYAGIGILMRNIYTDQLDFVKSNNLSHSLGFGIGLVF